MLLEQYKKFNFISLGFNLSGNFNKRKFWVSRFKKYIGFSSINFSVMSGYFFVNTFKKLSFFLNHFSKMNSLYLFVSLNKKVFWMSHVYKFLQKSIYSYFVYDWIFGAVSNHRRIFETYSLREQSLIKNMPEIGILIQTSCWTEIIISELKARNAFSIGFINPESVKMLDFPLPLTDNHESGFFIVNYFIKVLSLKQLNV